VPKVHTNINLTEQQHAWFHSLSLRTGISASELIRRALDEWRTSNMQPDVFALETPEQTYFRLAMFFRAKIDHLQAERGQPWQVGDRVEGFSLDGYKLVAEVTVGGPVAVLAMDIWKPDGEKLVIDKQAMRELQETVIQIHRQSMGQEN
jgi:hypothetical protein